MSPVFSRSKVPFSKNLNSNKIFNNLKSLFIDFSLQTSSKLSIPGTFTKLITFVLVSFLLTFQIAGQAGNLISPAFEQKSAISNLLRTLGLENKIKASAQTATPAYFTIQSTDTTGAGYKMTTSDAAGTENSGVKFTNSTSVTDQQRWYFDDATKLIKSAIANKCLATTNNQIYNPIIIKTCSVSDNAQIWDITSNLLKNAATGKCVNAAWSQISNTSNYENKWFDGRIAQLDNSCGWGFGFVALSSGSVSSSTISTSSSLIASSKASVSSSSNSTTTAQQFYTIESTDTSGAGYKMTTSDSLGTENSNVKFTNSTTINDQQRWYFEPVTKLIKSAISNKCLATIANQPYTNLVLKTCNSSDNTQNWDNSNNLIKNLFTGKCAVAGWTQNPTTLAWENKSWR